MKKFSEYTQELLNNGANVGYYPEEGHDFLIVHNWSMVHGDNRDYNPTPEFLAALNELTGCNPDEGWDDDYWGFSDEYSTCSECGNVVRTSPTSYHWTPDFWLSDDGLVCGDCVRTDWADDYIEDLVENRQDTARGCHLLDPEEHGFTLVLEGLENGFHPGQADNPLAIQEWASDNNLAVLWIVYPSQFSASFDGYMAWRDYCPTCKGEDWRNCPRCADRDSGYMPLTEEEKAIVLDALVEYTRDYGYGKRATYLKPDYRESPDLATRMEKAPKSLSKPFAKIHNDGSVDEFDTIEEMYSHLKGE